MITAEVGRMIGQLAPARYGEGSVRFQEHPALFQKSARLILCSDRVIALRVARHLH